jgi:hypothetical protein
LQMILRVGFITIAQEFEIVVAGSVTQFVFSCQLIFR